MSDENKLRPDDVDQEGGVNFGIYDRMKAKLNGTEVQPSETGLIGNMGIMDKFNQMRGNTQAVAPEPVMEQPAPEPVMEQPAPVMEQPAPPPVVVETPVPVPVQAEDPDVARFAAAKKAQNDANNLKLQGQSLIDQGAQVVQEAQAKQQELTAQGAQVVQEAQAQQQQLTAQGNELIAQGNNNLNQAIAEMGGLAPAAPTLPHGSTAREAYEATANVVGNINGVMGNVGSSVANLFGALTPGQQPAAANMTPEQQATAPQNGGFFHGKGKINGGTRKQKGKKQRKSKKAKKSKKGGSKKKSNK